MRRHRARKKLGLREVRIQILSSELDQLVARGLLAAELRDNRAAIRIALHIVLERAFARGK